MLYAYRCTKMLRCIGYVPHLNVVNFKLGEAPAEVTCHCGSPAKRSYKDERKGISGLALDRMVDDKTRQGYDPRMFLPTKKDFAGPTDPEGEKGMNEWMETHVPADSSAGKMVDPRKL